MLNAARPASDDLPTSRQLLRSTLLALAAATAILLTIVLPAEYAIDPTGAGRALGLTQMGELKMQLAAEEAADRSAARRVVSTASSASRPARDSANDFASDARWQDETRVVVPAGRGVEVKLVMRAGDQAHYRWQAAGGPVNFDLHAHGEAGEEASFEKGRAVVEHAGVIDATFDGEHGWFWRNLARPMSPSPCTRAGSTRIFCRSRCRARCRVRVWPKL